MSRNYARHYASLHPDTPEHERALQVLLSRWLKPHLPAHRTARILDVGCGRGYALGLLQDLGYTDLAGIDVDPGQVEFACAHDRPAQLVKDTVAHLLAETKTYDLILLMDVLEHVPVGEQSAFLSAIHRRLGPEGRLICTVPNAASPAASVLRYIDYTHCTLFTVESVAAVLNEAGLCVVRTEPAEFFVRPRFLFWLPTRRAVQWALQRLARWRWRLAYIGELGWDRGRLLILAPNLLVVAARE